MNVARGKAESRSAGPRASSRRERQCLLREIRAEPRELVGQQAQPARGMRWPGASASSFTRSAAPPGPESLTAREDRVAALAAEGLTNREIAQRLFVTVKAVQWHLRNVYRKLDIASRGELPTALRLGA